MVHKVGALLSARVDEDLCLTHKHELDQFTCLIHASVKLNEEFGGVDRLRFHVGATVVDGQAHEIQKFPKKRECVAEAQLVRDQGVHRFEGVDTFLDRLLVLNGLNAVGKCLLFGERVGVLIHEKALNLCARGRVRFMRDTSKAKTDVGERVGGVGHDGFDGDALLRASAVVRRMHDL